MPGGRKISLGTSKGGQAVGKKKKGSAIIDGSRFRETYFFSAGKKSKHADQRETMNIKKT